MQFLCPKLPSLRTIIITKSRNVLNSRFNGIISQNHSTETAKISPKTKPHEFPPDENIEQIQVTMTPPSFKPITVDTTSTLAKTKPEALSKTVSFDDVPGPQILKYISKFWRVIPIVGTQLTASTVQYLLNAGKIFGSTLSWGGKNVWLFKHLIDEYGPVVRLQGPFGGDVVILSRPEHASILFQTEGPFPIRSSLDCVEKYRMEFRKFKQPGPFLMYGPEWQQLRKTIEIPLNDALTQQFERVQKTCDEFVERIASIRNKQEEVPKDFYTEIQKWCMETLCGVTMNRKFGFLDPCGLSPSSDPGKLLESLNGATEAIQKCESGLHLFKYFETPSWKRLVMHCNNIDTVLNKYVLRAQDALRAKRDGTIDVHENCTLIENLLLTEGLISEDALTILLDMMLIGVNATSHAVAFLFYHLARSPRCQAKLHGEISQLTNLTRDSVKSLEYLQACIKESLRLKPPIPILSRVLNKDVVVHNYRIPKGTYMLMATHLSSLREEHFEDALKFKPERWISSETEFNKDVQVFASIPFGYGPKQCLAKELAEIQVALVTVKILEKFRIEYHYGDIESNHRLLAAPTRALKLRFVDRH